MSRARSIIEVETSTLVVHLDDRTTDFLKAIYAGKGYPVINGAVTKKELADAIRSHGRVFMLGHGCPSGLFGRSFMIDDEFGALLAEKTDGLYIWCNADAYAHRHKLSGLVSGMFISEVAEARYFGIEATQEEVDRSNSNFSRVVREIMDAGRPYSDVRQCYSNAECKITSYNNARLYVFDQGAASPALHPSSAAHARSWTAAEREQDQAEIGLDQSEYDWLHSYFANALSDLIGGKTDVETVLGGLKGVADEFLPGKVDDDSLRWLKNALDDIALSQYGDPEDLADELLSALMQD